MKRQASLDSERSEHYPISLKCWCSYFVYFHVLYIILIDIIFLSSFSHPTWLRRFAKHIRYIFLWYECKVWLIAAYVFFMFHVKRMTERQNGWRQPPLPVNHLASLPRNGLTVRKGILVIKKTKPCRAHQGTKFSLTGANALTSRVCEW